MAENQEVACIDSKAGVCKHTGKPCDVNPNEPCSIYDTAWSTDGENEKILDLSMADKLHAVEVVNNLTTSAVDVYESEKGDKDGYTLSLDAKMWADRVLLWAQQHDFDPDRCIAVVWSIEDLNGKGGVREDLTDKQALEVLQSVEHHHDADLGICWETLKTTADCMYTVKPNVTGWLEELGFTTETFKEFAKTHLTALKLYDLVDNHIANEDYSTQTICDILESLYFGFDTARLVLEMDKTWYLTQMEATGFDRALTFAECNEVARWYAIDR